MTRTEAAMLKEMAEAELDHLHEEKSFSGADWADESIEEWKGKLESANKVLGETT